MDPDPLLPFLGYVSSFEDGETRMAADALHAKAAEIDELTKRLETLTKDTSAW